MSLPFHHPFQENQYEIFEWYPKFQSCLQYFVERAQHTSPVQAVAAYVNIKLPYQKNDEALASLAASSVASASASTSAPVLAQHQSTLLPEPSASTSSQPPLVPTTNEVQYTLVIPYIRRLVATSFDSPTVLHGFFGDDWQQGIGPLHDAERRNYLFAAKSDSWLSVKSQYDMEDGQTVPFLRPLQNVTLAEIEAAEANWSEWLAMQDWMLGPRAPIPDGNGRGGSRGGRVKGDR